jgi:N-acetyl-anhydromuramyl-L-alanine amidase AmpD
MATPLDLSTIVQVNFSENQYYKEETPKNQIVLHHTVSGSKAQGVIDWWNQDPQKVATQFVVQGDGTIYQLYSSKFWAHHLGIKSTFLQKLGFADYGSRNLLLNKSSIAIEICNWGGLSVDDNGYHPAGTTKVTIPDDNVLTFEEPFRDYLYFEKYTPQQINSVASLVTYLCDKWNIPKTYNEDMWDVSKNAIGGQPGIWTHVSYRSDKSDMFPMPEMIEMLQGLSV